METTESNYEPSMKVYVGIWAVLILIVAAEVGLTYAHLGAGQLLAALLALAIVEAGLALGYFMHLKYDRPVLFWSLIPGLVFALLMLNQVWPDALRVNALRFPSLP